MSYDIDNWGDYRREMWAFPIHRAHERRRQATRWAQKRLKRLWYGADPFDTPEWRALCAHQARKMAYATESVGLPRRRTSARSPMTTQHRSHRG
jgi:hypothetical protein